MPEIVTKARRMVRMPDGKMVPWDDYHDPDPRMAGTNQSRNNFLHNCYTHPLGRFFQETIKKGLEAVIRRIHDKEIPRYDKNAYQYDDPRLQVLDALLKGMMVKHIDDNDTERKHAIFGSFVDIICFMCKEDIFYRARVLKSLEDLAQFYAENPDVFTLTPEELYNYESFRDCKGLSYHTVAARMPKFEEWKKLKGLA